MFVHTLSRILWQKSCHVLSDSVSMWSFCAHVCRYIVKVSDEHLATIQLCTSKSDVRLKLSVLDNDEEVASCEGKGHAVLTAFIFLPNSSSQVDATAHSISQFCKKYRNRVVVFHLLLH